MHMMSSAANVVLLAAVFYSVPSLGVSVVRDGKRKHSQKIADLREAAQKVCDTFPGNMCEPLIKAAHVPLAWNKANEGTQLRAAIRRKIASGEPFVFASFGSSITAGHDNHYNSSWPFMLERLLKPTFEKLGFGFELRQRAVGGWHENPYTVGCMHNRAGSGVDAVSWEWGLFADSKCAVESFMREAYSLNGEGQAPPVVMSVEHTQTNVKLFRAGIDDKQVIKIRNESFQYLDLEGPLVKRRWKPNEWYLSSEFISKDEVAGFEERLKQPSTSFLMKRSRSEEVAAFYGEQFQGLIGLKPNKEQQAAIEEAARAIAKKQRPTPHLVRHGVAQQFAAAGFGYEAFFATTGIEEVPHEWRPWYVAREKAFNINWHPGPLGHLLIASQLAHFILEQAQIALMEGSHNMGIPTAPPQGDCGAGVPRSCATGMFPHNGPDINATARGSLWKQGPSVDQGGLTFSLDHRKPLRLNKTGSLTLKVEAQQKGDVAVVCMAPCIWSCSEHKGLVGAGPSRFWPPRRDGAPTSKEKPTVSDVDFVLNGQRVSGDMLLEANEKVFGASGSYCAGCNITTEVCQAVGELDAKASHLTMRVSPKTDPIDPQMFVEILQMMVVPGPSSRPFDS